MPAQNTRPSDPTSAPLASGAGPAHASTTAPGDQSPTTPVPALTPVRADSVRAAGQNLLWNGGFGAATTRPWSLAFSSPRHGAGALNNGELCLRIDMPGTRTFDVAMRQGPVALARGRVYQVRFRTHATRPAGLRLALRRVGTPNTEYWSAKAASSVIPQDYAAVFEAFADVENVEFLIEFGGDLSPQAPLTICLDDIELNDPLFVPPIERSAQVSLPGVRVNQVGYLPRTAKIASVVSSAAQPLDWELVQTTSPAAVAARGKTRLFGADRSSGDHLHWIDFSSINRQARSAVTGWKLRVGSDESVPFDIDAQVYRRLKYDALAFFYLQRSGLDIKMPFAGQPSYERPAGHLTDRRVPCAPEARCSYSLDVSGGWYDAGDHGKYLVNSGLAVWVLQNQYESLATLSNGGGDFGDGKMNIPEAGNGKPDLLDEARWNLEFMLKMQVPAGQPNAGMAHHKIHGEKWTPIPTLPHQDPVKRYLRPVSTAATLNLAAAAAQGGRLWRKLDPQFSKRCLAAAETAFAAATANPAARAEREVQGGGAYGDGELADEFYWAAAELFISTGKPQYGDALQGSRLHAPKPLPHNAGVIGWQHVAPLGKISLTVSAAAAGGAPAGTTPVGALSADATAELRQQLIAAADRFLGMIEKRGYRVPMASESAYVWGSNGDVLNAAMVLGTAYRFTKAEKYVNGVVDCMNYILGHNPLAQSYVAGHGARAMRNPHHRVWANQKDQRFPPAPPGALGGGPNSMLQDPYIRKLGKGGCPPQTCYVDNVDSYSTNEVAINWNATLAWTAAFLDDVAQTTTPVTVTPAAAPRALAPVPPTPR